MVYWRQEKILGNVKSSYQICLFWNDLFLVSTLGVIILATGFLVGGWDNACVCDVYLTFRGEASARGPRQSERGGVGGVGRRARAKGRAVAISLRRQVGRGRGLRVLRGSGNPETRSAGWAEAATRRGAGSWGAAGRTWSLALVWCRSSRDVGPETQGSRTSGHGWVRGRGREAPALGRGSGWHGKKVNVARPPRLSQDLSRARGGGDGASPGGRPAGGCAGALAASARGPQPGGAALGGGEQ